MPAGLAQQGGGPAGVERQQGQAIIIVGSVLGADDAHRALAAAQLRGGQQARRIEALAQGPAGKGIGQGRPTGIETGHHDIISRRRVKR